MKKKIIISLLLLIILAISYYNSTNNKTTLANVSTIAINNNEINNNFNKVKQLQEYYNNSDIKATINIDNNKTFDYPVAQGNDNNYYLSHDYYKNKDNYGVVTLDYRVDLNSSKKILIYGHSSIKRDTYFNSLEKYYDKNYYEDNKYLSLETENQIRKYLIFSVYVETNDFTYMNMNFTNQEEWYSHLVNLKNKSLYDTNININASDEILILQTCSNKSEYKKYAKKYLLVIAKRVEE